MRLALIGGTNPVGLSAGRIALEHGHEVIVADSGKHEPTEPAVRHLHGRAKLRSHPEMSNCWLSWTSPWEGEAPLAPGGPIAAARPDVSVDTRTKTANAATLRQCARAARAHRLVVISSTVALKRPSFADSTRGSRRVAVPELMRTPTIRSIVAWRYESRVPERRSDATASSS